MQQRLNDLEGFLSAYTYKDSWRIKLMMVNMDVSLKISASDSI